MSRLGSGWLAIITSSLVALCFGCGGGVTTAPTQVVTPGIVTLSPQPDVSLEIGGVGSFTASAQDASGLPLTPSPLISFVSSNPTVVQVAASGLACAGKWDSLTNPQICTPGPVGTAVVTATSAGVSSPPATVHVHQHIDSIVLSEVPGQLQSTDVCKLGSIFPGVVGLSRTQTFNFQATAYYRAAGPAPGLDITDTVGPFNWAALNASASIVTLNSSASGLQPGQVKVTANNPGMTGIFASVSGVNSPPVQIITCPVKSISLAIQNTNETSFIVQNGSKTITATVTDSSDTEITGTNLLWSTSDASAFGASAGTVTSVRPGSATVIASCTPPTCNFGFLNPQAIYPQSVIRATGTGSGTGVLQTTTVWLASTECGVPDATTQVVVNNDNCVSTILPIDTATGITGVGVDLPVAPNSIRFNRQGTSVYLGTDSGRLGTTGLSIVSPSSTAGTAPTITSVTAAPGKVLAISPDGQKVIVSDTVDTPNQVFALTGSSTTTALPIVGATTAEFAPDSSKAYILAGTNLYVYSPSEALKKITLTAPATDVTFLANGAFAYLSGGSGSAQITTRKTCDSDVARDSGGTIQTVNSLPGPPQFIKTLPDATGIVALRSPGISLVDIASAPTGCAPPAAGSPGGFPTVQNGAVTSFNFGQGNFTPKQFMLASSGKRAYILASDLSNIIVFNLDSETTSTIQLSGNSIPLQASLSTDGKTLYVLAKDTVTNVSSVHTLDTSINADTNQFTLSQSLCHPKTNTTGTYTCTPNLIVAKP